MKKTIFGSLAIALLLLVTIAATNDNVTQFTKGNYKLKYAVPSGFTGNQIYNWPSFGLDSTGYDDTIKVTPTCLETWVKCDTLKGNSVLSLTNTGLYNGAKLYLQFNNDGTTRTVYLNQNGVFTDSFIVSNMGQLKRMLVFCNHKFERF